MVNLRCPVCAGALEKRAGAYLCPKNHSFDIAKSGYVNLLLNSSQGHHGVETHCPQRRSDPGQQTDQGAATERQQQIERMEGERQAGRQQGKQQLEPAKQGQPHGPAQQRKHHGFEQEQQ